MGYCDTGQKPAQAAAWGAGAHALGVPSDVCSVKGGRRAGQRSFP
ncbi:MAG: hypothetical protein WC340_14845 [Kiritimatiellia bacterium]